MRLKAFIAALGTAVLGMALLFVYMKRFEDQVRGGEPVEVVVARSDVGLGVQLSEDMLGVTRLPRSYVHARHVKKEDAQRILGIRVRSAIGAGEPVLWSDLATTTEQSRDLSALIREGMRAVTVGASVTSAFGGLLRPGDRVDVLLTMEESPQGPITVPLLQNVLVLAVGTNTGVIRVGEDDGREKIAQVTLALTVEQAQLITFGASRGNMSLTLRNPDDITVIEELPETGINDIVEAERRVRVQRRRPAAAPQFPGRLE